MILNSTNPALYAALSEQIYRRDENLDQAREARERPRRQGHPGQHHRGADAAAALESMDHPSLRGMTLLVKLLQFRITSIKRIPQSLFASHTSPWLACEGESQLMELQWRLRGRGQLRTG